MDEYFTFIRTCNNWQQFANAEKRVVDQGLTLVEAQETAREWNENRSAEEIENGTMMEFAMEGWGSNLVYPDKANA